VLWHFIVVAWFAGQMASPDASLSAALDQMNKGHLLESIQQLRQIVRSDPNNGPAWFYLSTLYTGLKEYDAAERYLQRAMQAGPKQAAHYYQLGMIRYSQSKWRPALESFQQALMMGPGQNEASVWRSIGDVQLELFDRDAALRAYMEALRIDSRDARTRLALGRFYLQRGEAGAAIEQLRAALDRDASLRVAYSVLGRAYLQSGEFASAVTTLKQAVDADPADQDSRYALGRALLAMGRADEGRAEMERYDKVREQVTTADRRYKEALARTEDGKLSEAETMLREVIRLAPSYGPALQSLGLLLLDRGSPERALSFLQRAVEVNPLNAEIWYGLGAAYFKSGRTREALDATKRATALNEDEVKYQQLLLNIEQRKK
jgi:tetratricopeptide (TPR) repeat protein